MRKIVIHLSVAVVWLCGVVAVVHAQTETKLTASDGATSDMFGWSVDLELWGCRRGEWRRSLFYQGRGVCVVT